MVFAYRGYIGHEGQSLHYMKTIAVNVADERLKLQMTVKTSGVMQNQKLGTSGGCMKVAQSSYVSVRQ